MKLFTPDPAWYRTQRRLFIPSYAAPVAPSFKSSGQIGGANSTTRAVPVPASGAAGDGLLGFQAVWGTSVGVTAPDATWYQVSNSPVEVSNHHVYIWRHRDPGTDSGSYTFNCSGQSWHAASVVRYGGIIDSDDFIDVVSKNSVSGYPPACPSMDTTVPNTKLAYYCGSSDDTDSLLDTTMSGWDLRYNSNYGDNSRQVADKTQSGTGATGSVGPPPEAVSRANVWNVWMGALKP